jgi:plastocyanin
MWWRVGEEWLAHVHDGEHITVVAGEAVGVFGGVELTVDLLPSLWSQLRRVEAGDLEVPRLPRAGGTPGWVCLTNALCAGSGTLPGRLDAWSALTTLQPDASRSSAPSTTRSTSATMIVRRERTGAGSGSATIASSFSGTTNVTIKAGESVTFDDSSGGTHHLVTGTNGQFTAAAGAPSEFSASAGLDLAPGDKKMVTFPTAGTYQITCTIHPSMQDTVTVTAA